MKEFVNKRIETPQTTATQNKDTFELIDGETCCCGSATDAVRRQIWITPSAARGISAYLSELRSRVKLALESSPYGVVERHALYPELRTGLSISDAYGVIRPAMWINPNPQSRAELARPELGRPQGSPLHWTGKHSGCESGDCVRHCVLDHSHRHCGLDPQSHTALARLESGRLQGSSRANIIRPCTHRRGDITCINGCSNHRRDAGANNIRPNPGRANADSPKGGVSKIRLLFQKIFVQFFPKHDSPKGFIFITAGRDLRKTVILRSLPVRQDRGGKSCLAGSFIGVQIPQVETCGYENPAFQAVSSAHGLRVKPAMTDTHEVGFRGSATGRSRKIAGIENSSERAISLAQGKANLAGKALCRKRILSDKPQRGVIRFVSFDYALSGLNDIVHPVRRAVPCAIDPALSELVTYLYHGDGYDAGATIAVATGKQKTETKSVMKTCIV